MYMLSPRTRSRTKPRTDKLPNAAFVLPAIFLFAAFFSLQKLARRLSALGRKHRWLFWILLFDALPFLWVLPWPGLAVCPSVRGWNLFGSLALRSEKERRCAWAATSRCTAAAAG